MDRQYVSGGKITVTQLKTGAKLSLSMLPDPIAAIKAMPADNLTYLVTGYGKSFTATGFAISAIRPGFRVVRLHGLRKSAMTRMAEAGFILQEIKARSGYKGDAEMALYIRNANHARLAEGSAARL